MKITIINGAPTDEWVAFEQAIDNLKEDLSSKHEVEIFTVRDMNIKYCIGCFGCWVKTPGRCMLKDDMETILKSIVKTDVQLFLSPAIAGYISSDAKKVMEREIPTLLPYLRCFDAELHHPLRYEKAPDLGVILMDDGQLDDETRAITFDTFDRLVHNFHCKRLIKATATAENIAEVIKNETRAH
ncbi:MAG: flavodoxin family protein [Eubacteriales bacterium]